MSNCVLGSVGTVYHVATGGGGQVLEAGTKVNIAAANRRLLMWFSGYDVGHAASVQLDGFGGAGFTPIANAGASTLSPLDCWYLDNPAVGDHTVYVGSGYTHGVCILQEWLNVDLSIAPIADAFTHFPDGGPSITTTIGAGGGTLVHGIGVYGGDSASENAVAGTPAGDLQEPGGEFAQLHSSYKPGTASVTFSWTGAADGSTMGVVLLTPLGGAPKVSGAFGMGGFSGFSR